VLLPRVWGTTTLLRGHGEITFGLTPNGRVYLPLRLTGATHGSKLERASKPWAGAFPTLVRGLWAEGWLPETLAIATEAYVRGVEELLAERHGPGQLKLGRSGFTIGALVRSDETRSAWTFVTRGTDGTPSVLGAWLAADADIHDAVKTSRLASLRVAIVGCGAVGWSVANLLARAGVRQFALYDRDSIHPENLRRLGAEIGDLGRYKVDALADALRAIAPGVVVDPHAAMIGYDLGARALLEHEPDLYLDLTAEAISTHETNVAALARDCPVIYGWVSHGVLGARLFRVRPYASACYECMCEASPIPIPALGRITSTWAGAMYDSERFAATVAKMAVLTLLGEPVSETNPDHVVLRYDGVRTTTETIEIPRRRSCELCGGVR
jgi:Dinucleotide-utilizing enzymes involved in molybdopterin and thiamine biosynthesis family 2